MKEMHYCQAKNMNILPASEKAKEEDLQEVIGILLSLLVIAAFIFIAITMAKIAGDAVTSEVVLAY